MNFYSLTINRGECYQCFAALSKEALPSMVDLLLTLRSKREC